MISMYIRLKKLLEVEFPNAKYDLKKRPYKAFSGANRGDNDKIKEVMVIKNNKNNDKEDFLEKNRQ